MIKYAKSAITSLLQVLLKVRYCNKAKTQFWKKKEMTQNIKQKFKIQN